MPFSPSALNLSHHQGLFQWVISSHQMNKTLELQLYISPSSEYSGLISLRLTGLIFLLEITKDSPNVSDCLEISKGMNFIYIYLGELQSLLRVGFYKTFPSYSLLFAVVQNPSNPSILQQLDASMWTGRVLFPNFSFSYRRSNKWNEAAQQPWEDALCWPWQNVGFPPIERVRFVLKSEIKICILDSYIRIIGKGGFNQENKRRLW